MNERACMLRVHVFCPRSILHVRMADVRVVSCGDCVVGCCQQTAQNLCVRVCTVVVAIFVVIVTLLALLYRYAGVDWFAPIFDAIFDPR